MSPRSNNTFDTDPVYIGAWINWTYGMINGWTVTVPGFWGNVIIAFITLFVAFTSTQLWGIICFILHQRRSSREPRTADQHQVQVALRNAQSQVRLLTDLLTIVKTLLRSKPALLAGSRRSQAPDAWLSILGHAPLILSTVAFVVLFTFMSLFATKYLDAGDAALVKPTRCGWPQEVSSPIDLETGTTDRKRLEVYNGLSIVGRDAYRSSVLYARACYGGLAERDLDVVCKQLRNTGIALTVDTIPCPFADPSVCKADGIKIGYGHLDSHVALGVNSRPRDRIVAKKTITCAPIHGTRYLTIDPDHSVFTYNLGPSPSRNITFKVSISSLRTAYVPFPLDFYSYYPGNASHSFLDPIPDLLPAANNSDLLLLGIEKPVGYILGPTRDPWFEATERVDDPTVSEPLYVPFRDPIGIIGCQEQYQFCDVNASSCSPAGGLYQVQPGLHSWEHSITAKGRAIFNLLWKAMWSSQLQWQFQLLGSDFLLATDVPMVAASSAIAWLSLPLPSDQWKREVLAMANNSLTMFQRRFSHFAAPPQLPVQLAEGSDFSILDSLQEIRDDDAKELCNNIMVSRPDYKSFRLAWVLALVFSGLVLACFNVGLPALLRKARGENSKMIFKNVQWAEHGKFQLLRLAIEAKGSGPWENKDEQVPRPCNAGDRTTWTGDSYSRQQ